MHRTALIVFVAIAVTAVANAQKPPAWNDDFVDHFAGTWTAEGTVMGRAAHHTVIAEWVLNRQFLRISEKTSAGAPATESPYEATWYLGYDFVSERYVMHLIDVFGGRFSETLGYGTRDGNDLRFVFEYGDGPFRNRWRWVPESRTWEWHLEQKNEKGEWKTFADFRLKRTESTAR